jgi:hypothetical protein
LQGEKEDLKEVKMIIVLTWLIICLLPLTVKAEEPVKAPAGEGLVLTLSSPKKERPVYRLSLQELMKERVGLSDEELGLITGRALVTDTPEISVSTDSRIILWDEVKTNAHGAINHGGGQSITTISR